MRYETIGAWKVSSTRYPSCRDDRSLCYPVVQHGRHTTEQGKWLSRGEQRVCAPTGGPQIGPSLGHGMTCPVVFVPGGTDTLSIEDAETGSRISGLEDDKMVVGMPAVLVSCSTGMLH